MPSSLRYTISDRLLLAATQAEAEAVMEAEVEGVQGECGRRDCGNERKRREKTIRALRQLAIKCTEEYGGLER